MSCQVYYYSGAYDPQLKRDLNIDQLFSVYHEKKLITETIKYKREHPEYTARIMCDSGAFTHFQQMKKKGLTLTDQDIIEYTDTYLEFLNEWGDGLDCFVGVDSVPDPENVDPTYGDKTWENYLYMWERLKPEIRHKLIPVFHYGEEWKHLVRFLEHVHPDGSKLDYIGLAISLEGTRKVRINWGQEAMKIIADSSNPNVKTHAFGVGVKSVLEHIDVYSTDATSYLKRAAYGMISIDDKTIYVSDIQKELLRGNHYSEKSAAYQKSVEDIIHERGFTLNPYELNYDFMDADTVKFTLDGEEYHVHKDNETNILLIHGDEIDTLKLSAAEDAPEGADKFYGTWEAKRKSLVFDGLGTVQFDPGNALATNCYARAVFNIQDTENWMQTIRTMPPATIKTKVELW